MSRVDPFDSPLPDRLAPWPKQARCAHFTLDLKGPLVLEHAGSWLEPLETVLRFVCRDPRVLAAIARGDDAPTHGEGIVIARIGPAADIDGYGRVIDRPSPELIPSRGQATLLPLPLPN